MSGPPAVGVAAYGFLAFAGVALPLAAVTFARGEARRSAGEPPDRAGPSRIALYANTLFTHAVLFGAAMLAARVEGVGLFGRAALDTRSIAAAGATLVAMLAVGELSWHSRTRGQRERLWVRRILPRTRVERFVWVLVSFGAALAEEVAYRGAFLTFAALATGSLPVAVVGSAAAFAALHAPQGLAGVGYVFVIAILQHALVLFTGTLVLAIAVHFAYDVLAGLWLAKRHGLTTAACCVLRAASGAPKASRGF